MIDDNESTKIVLTTSVKPENIATRIDELKQQLSTLGANVQELIVKQNHIYSEMAQSMDQLKVKDLEELKKWAENEEKAAKNQYEFESETNENDYQLKLEKLKTRAKMLIKYKYEKIIKTMPEISEYFHQFQIPLFTTLSEIESFPDDDLSDVSIYMSQEPLLKCDDSISDLELIQNQKVPIFSVTQRSLRMGKTTFPVGCPVSITLQDLISMNATIASINPQKIAFDLENGVKFSVSLLMLNSGLVIMKKC
ncbi:hypothetical protein TRFO_14489 [Tritrichomonas foetus]|uniref:Uncharacterized protein n=1 Tax=Tritrichomonas foetus TaxID=1144522 RepID=A0A1J4KZJ3_9EUKA|nr:hypothetical protein TRFO_14489 [Tritrichomonas foetus]|eukprot:OHT15126.1 hypothetical protein TRFO_14489 [Tritrichomonas foetus]